MKKILLSIALFTSLNLFAQNKVGVIYDQNAEVRKVPSFSAIRVSNAIELYLTQSNKTAVAVSASSEELRDEIITEVVGGTLIIRLADGNSWWNRKNWNNSKTKAYVSVVELNALHASGATSTNIINGLKGQKLKVTLSGASDLKGSLDMGTVLFEMSGASNTKLTIESGSIYIKGSGACDIEVKGKADDMVVDLSGATDAKLFELVVKAAQLKLSGASHARVNVTEMLKVNASGASDVDYKGSPSVKEVQSSGASSIKPRN